MLRSCGVGSLALGSGGVIIQQAFTGHQRRARRCTSPRVPGGQQVAESLPPGTCFHACEVRVRGTPWGLGRTGWISTSGFCVHGLPGTRNSTLAFW